ncbi:MAG: zinc/manganese transport system substrate-binding protein [Pseudonocardiales bacterium]|jgi:zinc/manganese transport system substrate-binding protein|nr:zinc/manganese transport system substrate-binding protein [Pseudonocardiales bacterium]
MNLRRAILTPALATSAALALAACGSGAPAATNADGTTALSVVASTDVYGAIAQAIGGDAVKVTSIINSPDADPHEYEAKPADAVAVDEAKVLVYNGAGYDDFATKLLAASGTKPTTIDVSELSGLQAPAGGTFNEHVWYSFPTVKKLASTLAADLGAADPAQASTFTANATAFNAKIDGLTAKLDAVKAAHSGEKVGITEPVPLYMVQAAGLVDATPAEFSQAVEEGTDPPAAVLADTLKTLQGPDKVKALLPNAQTETPLTKQVEQAATAGGVPVVKVSETLPAGVTDYVAWMTQQVDALAAALGTS